MPSYTASAAMLPWGQVYTGLFGAAARRAIVSSLYLILLRRAPPRRALPIRSPFWITGRSVLIPLLVVVLRERASTADAFPTVRSVLFTIVIGGGTAIIAIDPRGALTAVLMPFIWGL
eukprot:COSAG05_NODE_3286_length_2176_cov_7.519981_2_plen_118_part_00